MFKRPKLSTQTPESRVPENLQIKDLSDWLINYEAQQPFVVDGGAARIRYQDPESPAQTPFAFLGIHGFSACRQETAPVTQRLAENFRANLIEVQHVREGIYLHARETGIQIVLEIRGREHADELLALANKHELKHSVEALPLASAQEAHERLIAGTVAGRIALVP